MARTPSTMIPLGTPAPKFSLPDAATGKKVSLDEVRSPVGTVVMFICNHCPFVKHIIGRLVQVAAEYQAQGISFVAINSNDVSNYPEDSPEHMKELARQLNFPFPYLYDERQEAAHAFQAACTPDFFVFDKDLALVYRGQFDESRPGSDVPPSGKDLAAALDALISGFPVPAQQMPSLGCNIKWKTSGPGMEQRFLHQ